jgi:hypothetical protein
MRFLEGCKSFLLYLAAILHSSPSFDGFDNQSPLHADLQEYSPNTVLGGGHAPKFPAPHGPDSESPFICKYPVLKDWTNCSTPENRGCWLKGPSGKEFNINTDYENEYPEGITREVGTLPLSSF